MSEKLPTNFWQMSENFDDFRKCHKITRWEFQILKITNSSLEILYIDILGIFLTYCQQFVGLTDNFWHFLNWWVVLTRPFGHLFWSKTWPKVISEQMIKTGPCKPKNCRHKVLFWKCDRLNLNHSSLNTKADFHFENRLTTETNPPPTLRQAQLNWYRFEIQFNMFSRNLWTACRSRPVRDPRFFGLESLNGVLFEPFLSFIL